MISPVTISSPLSGIGRCGSVMRIVKAYVTARGRQNHCHISMEDIMLRLVTRQRLLIALTIATSMGIGYALAQQPHMDATLRLLQDAHHELEQAVPNKGGHRERALGFIDQAIGQVRDGIAYAASHH
jgi:hypothetical protein